MLPPKIYIALGSHQYVDLRAALMAMFSLCRLLWHQLSSVEMLEKTECLLHYQ